MKEKGQSVSKEVVAIIVALVVIGGLFFALTKCSKKSEEQPQPAKRCSETRSLPVVLAAPKNICSQATSTEKCRADCEQTGIPASQDCLPQSEKDPFWTSDAFTIKPQKNCSNPKVDIRIVIKADNNADTCAQASAKLIAKLVDASDKPVDQILIEVNKLPCKTIFTYEGLFAGVELGKAYKVAIFCPNARS